MPRPARRRLVGDRRGLHLGLRRTSREDEAVAQAAWAHARALIEAGEHRLVVLDEITYPMNWGWIDRRRGGAAIAGRPAKVNVVCTGRDAPAALIDVADTVTEMRKVKHAYDTGVMRQEGHRLLVAWRSSPIAGSQRRRCRWRIAAGARVALPGRRPRIATCRARRRPGAPARGSSTREVRARVPPRRPRRPRRRDRRRARPRRRSTASASSPRRRCSTSTTARRRRASVRRHGRVSPRRRGRPRPTGRGHGVAPGHDQPRVLGAGAARRRRAGQRRRHRHRGQGAGAARGRRARHRHRIGRGRRVLPDRRHRALRRAPLAHGAPAWPAPCTSPWPPGTASLSTGRRVITLVLGGARSGKSAVAEDLAAAAPAPGHLRRHGARRRRRPRPRGPHRRPPRAAEIRRGRLRRARRG